MDVYVPVNPSSSAVCEVLRLTPESSGSNKHNMFKITKIPFIPHSDSSVELTLVVSPVLKCIAAMQLVDSLFASDQVYLIKWIQSV